MARFFKALRSWWREPMRKKLATARLHARIAAHPREVERLAFREKTVGPKTYFLTSVALNSLIVASVFGDDPMTHLHTPAYVEPLLRIVNWLVPIGLPLMAALVIALATVATYALLKLLSVKTSFSTLWNLALLDAGTSNYVLLALAVPTLLLAVSGAFLLALIPLLVGTAFLLWWRYVQFRWVVGSRKAPLATALSYAAAALVFYPVNTRVEAVRLGDWAMKPTILPGDVVLVDRYERFIRGPRIGEIYYLCAREGECVARRMIAASGDVVQFADGVPTINGRASWRRPGGTGKHCEFLDRRIVEDALLIEGMPNGREHYVQEYYTPGAGKAPVNTILGNLGGEAVELQPESAAASEPVELQPSGGGFRTASLRPIGNTPRIVVPAGRYLFAADSRSTGLESVPPLVLADASQIEGRIAYRLWPLRMPLDDVSSESEVHDRVDPWLC